MVKSETVRVKIIDTNENGAGVARHDGVVVFVPSLVEGDTADVRITDIKKNYAVGEAVGLIEHSPHRICPVCPSSDMCGGCSLSHVSYEYENLLKRNTVRSALRRAGLPYSLVGETVYAPSRTGYRNKVTVHFDEKSRSLGLYSEKTNDVVPFEGCALCPDEFNGIISFLNKNSALLSDAAVTEIMLKSSSGGKVLVIIKTHGNIDAISKKIKDEFPFAASVIPQDDAADEYVVGEYSGIKMRFSAAGFRQVNNDAFSRLLDVVVKTVGECDFNSCADLYCGSGVIGLTLASSYPGAYFYGIELNEKSVSDARYNAASNGIGNIKFFAGDASDFMNKIPHESAPSLVVVDPPRAGLSDKMRRELTSLSPEKIIYVSCNPQTMARDAKYLGCSGYTLKSATPVNMFPMTRHVETVCLLSRQ